MPADIEVNMKIPSLTVRSDGTTRKIDNGSLRFIKRMTLNAVPKPGESFQVSTRAGAPFECTVTRTEWDDAKNIFVVSCSYSRRSITPEEHAAITTDPDWAVNQLP